MIFRILGSISGNVPKITTYGDGICTKKKSKKEDLGRPYGPEIRPLFLKITPQTTDARNFNLRVEYDKNRSIEEIFINFPEMYGHFSNPCSKMFRGLRDDVRNDYQESHPVES